MSTALAHAAIFVPVAVVVAVLMDAWAGLLHGRVWHGALFSIHRSHHEPRVSPFEKNDAFAFAHAPPAIALILYGCLGAEGPVREALFGVGVGMTAFAIGYLIVHDGLVHGRLPVAQLLRITALRRVVRAHRVHHAGNAGGAPYSLFLGPAELRRRGKKLKGHDRSPQTRAVAGARAPRSNPSAPRP